MSDELRRALADAAASPPPVDDWLAPVHRGVRLRRRRRAVQQAGAGTALAVLAGLLGASLLPTRDSDTLLPPPVPSPSPSASAPVLPSPAPASPTAAPRPTASPRAGLPVRPLPAGSPSALPRLTPRPAPVARASAAGASPPAAAAPRSPSPAAGATPTRTPSPAPTAGAQQGGVSVSPPDRSFPAGEEVVLTVTATGSAERPPAVLALRVDGEPVEQDPVRSCAYPASPPPRSPQRAERRFTVVLTPGEHVLEAVADDGCSWYRGRARVTYTVTAS